MKTRTNVILVILALLAYFSGLRTANAFYDPGLQRWLNRDPINEQSFQNLTSRVAAFSSMAEGNLYCLVANNPVDFWDYLGLDNPGCDPPGNAAGNLCPDKKDCFLRCCAKHDKCFYDHGCTVVSWIFPKQNPLCTGCNAAVTACFVACITDINPPTGPRWFCPNGPNAGKYYDDYSKIPASCWKNGNKPPQP